MSSGGIAIPHWAQMGYACVMIFMVTKLGLEKNSKALFTLGLNATFKLGLL